MTVAGALALVGALLVGPSSPAGAAATTVGQVVTVSAPSSTSTVATVEAWARQPDGRYKRVVYFPNARIGSQGMGTTSEGLSRTPTGRFKLTQPFGIKPNPGVTTSYFRVDRNDVWTGSQSTVINQHRRCAPGTCPAGYGTIERLSNFPGPYDYGVFIGYNAPAPVDGRRARQGLGVLPAREELVRDRRLRRGGGHGAGLADALVPLLRRPDHRDRRGRERVQPDPEPLHLNAAGRIAAD